LSSCVYVHTCMKMHCYFLLNVKRGASQLYWGGGLQLSSAGTGSGYRPSTRVLDFENRSHVICAPSASLASCSLQSYAI